MSEISVFSEPPDALNHMVEIAYTAIKKRMENPKYSALTVAQANQIKARVNAKLATEWKRERNH